MARRPGFEELLRRAPTRRMLRLLVRCVPQLAFSKKGKPSFLYTSGRANRCNPAGVDCLYFSETEATADAEYRRGWQGLPAEHQPKLTFKARVKFGRILDLDDEKTMTALRLSPGDLEAPWRLAARPTRLQELGRAISEQRAIAALRFPSVAARREGLQGWNVAVYPKGLVAPNRVEILGASDMPLEVLP